MKNAIYTLDVGGTYLKSALFDENGKVIEGTNDSQPVNSDTGTIEEIRESFKKLADRVKEKANELGYVVTRVGIDTPGPFDYQNGIFLMTHKFKSLYGFNFTPWFNEDFPGCPIKIFHDAAAFILGASQDVKNYREHNVAGVMLGTGLGFQMILKGKVAMNEKGLPVTSIWGRPYKESIAEDYISARGIFRRYNEIKPDDREELHDAYSVAKLAYEGDEYGIKAYQDVAKMLGEYVYPILMEYGIDTMVLGGQVSKSYDLLEKTLKENLPGIIVLPSSQPDFVHFIGTAIGCLYY